MTNAEEMSGADVVDFTTGMEAERVAAEPEYWFSGRGEFWVLNAAGEWVPMVERSFRRFLVSQGVRGYKIVEPDAGIREVLSPVDQVLQEVELNRRVAFAGPLAGYPAGLHHMGGERALVTRSPRLVEPERGDWAVVGELLENLLSSAEDGVDQTVYFFGWLRQAMECLRRGWWNVGGLCLAIAGERECGKSLLVQLIRLCFGGRQAMAYEWLVGRDMFNDDVLESPLLVVDDVTADTSFKGRKHFADMIKGVVAVSGCRFRGLGKRPMTLYPFHRLVICMNLEADCIKVLPVMDDQIWDKLMLLRAYRRPMPMPVSTDVEKRAFWERLVAELPAFLWWLEREWEAPEELKGRFGVRHFHHSEILEKLDEHSPHMRLMEFLERALFPMYEEWRGTASDLRAELQGEDSRLSQDEKQGLRPVAYLGEDLTNLSRKFGSRRFEYLHSKTGGKRREWCIRKEAGGD